MPIEEWINSDTFDIIRHKSNDNFNEIGKIKRDASEDLEYISDVLVSGAGVVVDHTQPDGLTYVNLEGLNPSNAGKYFKVNGTGTGLTPVSFDLQHTSTNFTGALKPVDTTNGDVILSLTAVSGNARGYMVTIGVDLDRDSTSPVQFLILRKNGVDLTSKELYMPSYIGRVNHTITYGIGGVNPGDVIDAKIIVSGSTNQYRYYACYLTILGIPT